MVAPISNDKLPPFSSTKAGNPDSKSSGSTNAGRAETGSATAEAAKPADNMVSIDRADELYRSATSEPTWSSGNINTAEEAAQLAARISKLLVADGAEAMRAQAGGQASQIGALLSTAP